MKNKDYNLKKNLLDLNYNKCLQHYNTLVNMLFAYYFGLIIGIITKQIDYNDEKHLAFVLVFSIIIAYFILRNIYKVNLKLSNIINQIENYNNLSFYSK